MPEFYYSATEMGRQAGFPSPASWTRMREAMPTPDCVMVSKAPAAGWTLNTWEANLHKQVPARQEPLREAIGRLRDREVELLRSYDEGVAEFLDLERVKPNTLGNTRMLRQL